MCRQAMSDHGLQSESFCYPYGSRNSESEKVVGEAGYRVGMALGKRPPKVGDSLLAIPRIVVAFGDALTLLIYKLHIRSLLRPNRV